MRLPVVLHIVGVILRVFGAIFLAPLAVALLYGEPTDAVGFGLAAVVAGLVGELMRRAGTLVDDDLHRVEGLAIVAGTWLIVAHVGAVPYYWAGLGPIDALFESMSGLTTTGATVFEDFTQFGYGIYFWRSLSQWLGGMGVIALFVAVLPRLSIGGRQLFFAEAPGPSDEKLTPQIRKTAVALWMVYGGLTAVEFVLLMAAGMSAFEAACHSFTTLAAGGFSPHPLSIMGYESQAIEWIIVAFMFLAGANFAVQYRVLRGQTSAVRDDEELRVYAVLVVVAGLAVALAIWRTVGSASDAIRHGLFQTLSILTTTGYASTDFELWNDQAKIILFVLMFIGGCAGSAGGGPKVVRQILIARYTVQELKRTLHPRAVLPVKLGGRVVPDEVMRGVLVFFLFYLLVFAVCTTIVTLLGTDLLTGMTATIATLGNIGPGFSRVGPMANFAHLHPVSKVVLTAAMWIGRLEVLTVLALLRPEVWKTARWSTGRPRRPRMG